MSAANVVTLPVKERRLPPLFGVGADGKAAPYRDRAVFAGALMTDASLSAGEFRVATLLVALFDYERGYAWPAIATIGERLGMPHRTVERAVQGLAGKGWFRVEVTRGRGKSNRYVPNVDRLKPDSNGGFSQTKPATPDAKTRQMKARKPAKSCTENPPPVAAKLGLPDTGLTESGLEQVKGESDTDSENRDEEGSTVHQHAPRAAAAPRRNARTRAQEVPPDGGTALSGSDPAAHTDWKSRIKHDYPSKCRVDPEFYRHAKRWIERLAESWTNHLAETNQAAFQEVDRDEAERILDRYRLIEDSGNPQEGDPLPASAQRLHRDLCDLLAEIDDQAALQETNGDEP